MTKRSEIIVSEHGAAHGSVKSYVSGFVISVILTIMAFLIVSNELASGSALLSMILGLAVIQLFVQAIFFLHLGKESKPRWNLQLFVFMVATVIIIVGGSLWIMANLDYHHQSMSPAETDSEIIKDEGYKE